MWRVVVLASAIAAGCGRLDFARVPGDGGPDESPDGSSDGAPDAACVLGPFGPVRPLTELNSSADESDPELSSDGLEIFFRSTRMAGNGQPDLWRAVRASVDQPFDPPTPVTELNTANWEGDPALSSDGLTLWYTGGAFPVDIYRATRSARGQPFGAPTIESVINSGEDDASPWVNASGTEIYFSSKRTSNDNSHELWRATRAAPGMPFQPPVRIEEMVAPREQCCPALSPDGQEMIFASRSVDVPGRFAVGHVRWTGSAWGDLQAFAPAVSTSDDSDVGWSRDGRAILFTSDRPGGMGLSDLYIVERSCP